MASVTPPTVDRVNYRISSLLFRRIWRLAKPYWARKAAWPSVIAAAAIILSLPASGLLSVLQTYMARDMTNAIMAKHPAVFWPLLIGFAVVLLCIGLTDVVASVIGNWLNQHWRKWLTIHLVDQYLAKRTYYDIALAEDLDNPDQRIQENVAPFVNVIVTMPRQVLLNAVTIMAGSGVLATINSHMLVAVLSFAVFQAVTLYFLYIPTIRRNFEVMIAEADLRYGILHVRDNAEAIAFYSGEAAERMHIVARLKTAAHKQLALLYYNSAAVNGGYNIQNVVLNVLPYFVLVPLFFSGELNYGTIVQATTATGMILVSAMSLSQFIPMISQAAPQAVRLAQIQERFEQMDAGRRRSASSQLTVTRDAPQIRLEHVTLETPGGEQTLVRDVSLTLSPGEHLIVVGQTGVGKSSLLRAMAGLWTRGSGRLQMPPSEACFFLPQRPYMILADLRAQLLYPFGERGITDFELERVLEAVNLAGLASRHGGLGAVRDWGKVLSLGEQQRIGFARLLLSRSQFVFLDEATSAVDFTTETRLYQLLTETGASFVSVGHRLSILDYHTHVLTLYPGGGWKVEELGTGANEEARRLLANV